MTTITICTASIFLSTLSLRRATCGLYLINDKFSIISIHALLAESDQLYINRTAETHCISIHALLAESDSSAENHANSQQEFLSTLSLRRATHYPKISIKLALISIHALLAESDNCTSIGRPKRLYFYPRSPCGERLMHALKLTNAVLFLSTLSLRRATPRAQVSPDTSSTFLSTLSLRRATRRPIFYWQAEEHFYPRSPCGERRILAHHARKIFKFLSTLSLRRATVTVLGIQHRVGISIHALLAESDGRRKSEHILIINFYPRSPCGERQPIFSEINTRGSISIHALLAESDESQPPCARPTTYFYPRSPCGERRRNSQNIKRRHKISIHALLAESDCYSLRHSAPRWYFYPRSPCGERRITTTTICTALKFLSTLSLRRAT